MGHRAQERAYRPKEPEGSHPPPRHRLYARAAKNERYKEPAQRASRRTHRRLSTRSGAMSYARKSVVTGSPGGRGPESMNTGLWNMGSGFAAAPRPRMTGLAG